MIREGLILEDGVIKAAPTFEGHACYLVVNGKPVTEYPFQVEKDDIATLKVVPVELEFFKKEDV